MTTTKTKHPEIFDWAATRSGAHITVTGKDVAGDDKKVTGVTRIQNGLVFSDDGCIHRLVTAER